jgi:hypothetical protein
VKKGIRAVRPSEAALSNASLRARAIAATHVAIMLLFAGVRDLYIVKFSAVPENFPRNEF